MIHSKTKYQANKEDLQCIFEKYNLGRITSLIPFGGGEFNTACRIDAAKDDICISYVMKFSPPLDVNVLTYEQNMMTAEVYWYQQIAKHTDIRIPHVYLFDDSREIIPVPYFVMELICGEPLWAYALTAEKRMEIQQEKLRMLSQIHKIKGDYFGYYQGKHYTSWYEAIRSMVLALIRDCEALGKNTPDGRTLLTVIDKHQDILRVVPSRMVNFDLWDSNVLLQNGQDPVWIDPERSFYGDPIGDMITQGKSQMDPLAEKEDEIKIYNEFALEPFSLSPQEEIRYAVMVAYLALIEEVEKYVRYDVTDENFQRNTRDARAMYDMAFRYL